MAPRNPTRKITVTDFAGYDGFDDAENLPPSKAYEGRNTIVTATGSFACLRAPANFNDATSHSQTIISAFDYDRNAGNLILYDIGTAATGSNIRTYSTTGGANTTVRSNQAENATWKRLLINDWAYGINGTEFVQTNGTTTYAVGITAPASAPTVSIVAGGSGTLSTGVTVSYAYRNSTTLHVSAASAASTSSGATSGGNNTLRVAVTASTQTGVDGIVMFITEDGGSVRYLYVDSSGDPVVDSNTTGNIDVSVVNIRRDTLTPETEFNERPPTGARFMFRWKDRICLADFRTATTRQQIQYNGFESCYYGIPWESWPSLNIINIPNKGDAARGGIETPQGALVYGEQDSYLLSGYPTDKVSSPAAAVSVTEHLEQLGWSIGTRSPKTAATTPYGAMWLDQNKRIQLWNYSDFPVEIGMPLRDDLAEILDTSTARDMAEAVWFQHGEAGGYYVLTASISGSANNRLFFITVYTDPQTRQPVFACAPPSDIAAQSLVVAEVSGRKRLFIGITDRLREILDLDISTTAGWGASQERYFSLNIQPAHEFDHWYSLAMDCGTAAQHIQVSVANDDGSDSYTLDLHQDEDGSSRGLMDSYGGNKRLRFTFPSNDAIRREIRGLRVYSIGKRRVL